MRRFRLLVSALAVVLALSVVADAQTSIFIPMQAVGRITMQAVGSLAWVGRAIITSPADAQIAITDNAGTGATATKVCIGPCTASFPMLRRAGAVIESRLGDDSAYGSYRGSIMVATTSFAIGGSTTLLMSSSGPSAPSSCGTTPAVTTANGSTSFVVTGGTGGTATGCTVTMPTASNGWNCSINNITSSAAHRADKATVQTASTTTSVTWEYQTVSTGAATAFTASDVFRGVCIAY